MKTFKLLTAYKLAIIGLLMLNTGLLVYIWFVPNQRRQQPAKLDDFLIQELNLDSEQQEKFQVLKDEHKQTHRHLRDQSKEAHERFFDLIKTDNPDSVQVKRTLDRISSVERQLDMATFEHFQKLRAICNPDQRKKFDNILNEALRIMAPKPPPQERDGHRRGERDGRRGMERERGRP